jgi:hypothetical protein
MHLSRLIASAAVTIVSLASLVAFGPARRGSTEPKLVANDANAREIRRIRIHFDSVLADLTTADTHMLSAAQRERRSLAIATIQAYRDRGVFPHNYDFPGRLVPYFVDRKTGTLCAVGHLLASTGRRDIVDRVSRANNNVWVRQLAGDTAFAQWLNDNGLTLAEAALIQIVYAQPVSTSETVKNGAFIIAAPFTLAGSIITSVSNLRSNADGHSRRTDVIGAASGVAAMTVGARLETLSSNAGSRQIAASVMAIGATSVALSAHGIYRHHEISVADREARRHSVALSAMPVLIPGRHPSTGVNVSLIF